jgi:hypothetical protein
MPEVPHDVSPAPLGTVAAIQPLWDAFRAGGIACCPRDGGPMALSVDGLGAAYRFVCVSCGQASVWFEARITVVSIKGTISPESERGG